VKFYTFELISLFLWIMGICNNSLIQVLRATRDCVLREYVACNVGIDNKSMAESADSMQDIFHPTNRTKSEVWAYFGFFKNAEGQLLGDNYPVCRTCKKKVAAEGSNTTNLLAHFRVHHPQLYSQCKRTSVQIRACKWSGERARSGACKI